MEKCLICGKSVNTNKGNCVKTDNGYTHKRCPKSKEEQNPLETKQYKQLTDTINEQYLSKPSDWYKKHSLNWTAVTNQIQILKHKGYSYADIEYAAIEVFKEFGAFLGFGAVSNRIVSIIAKRDRRLEIEKSIKEVPTTNEVIVLSSIIEEDIEW